MGTWLTGSPGIAEPICLAYSENESFTGDAFTASAVLRCPWADRYVLFNNIITNNKLWPYNTALELPCIGGGIIPTPEIQTNVAGVAGTNNYLTADVTVNFERKTGSAGGSETFPEAIYLEQLLPSAEMLKLANEMDPNPLTSKWAFRWGSSATADKLTPEEAPSRLVIGLDYVVRWSGLSAVPAIVLTIPDHVNNAAVTSPSLGLTFATETLLAQAPVLSRAQTGDPATSKWDLEARFSYRANTWNKYWRAKTNTFEQMYLHQYPTGGPSPAVYKNFPTADFTGLLP